MTLVKVNKKEKDTIARALAECGIGVQFFTMEENEALILAEIACDDPSMMWHLGKFTGHTIAHETINDIL